MSFMREQLLVLISVLYSDRRAVQAIGRIDRGADQNEGLKGTLVLILWGSRPGQAQIGGSDTASNSREVLERRYICYQAGVFTEGGLFVLRCQKLKAIRISGLHTIPIPVP